MSFDSLSSYLGLHAGSKAPCQMRVTLNFVDQKVPEFFGPS